MKIKSGSKTLNKIRVSFSKLSPIISSDSIVKKVKAVRKRLDEISKDNVVSNLRPYSLLETENQRSSSLRSKGTLQMEIEIIGRENDKEAIVDFLFSKGTHGDDNRHSGVSVIAIVGIGCVGKTTLAQLVYGDQEVQKHFERRWWACISSRSVDEKEILECILKSVTSERSSHLHGFTISQLYSAIMDSIDTSNLGKYLLVLDDVRDCGQHLWVNIMSMFRRGSVGNRIIITTPSLSVAKAMGADQIYPLNGLTEKDSWELFRRLAFQPEYVNDPHWISLGREIVGRCAGVPLAIKSTASLLYTKDTIQDWQYYIDKKIQFGDVAMPTARLSYDALPSYLKPCLAYCSLFPKGHVFLKDELIRLWIGQGFVMPDSYNGRSAELEVVGSAYFAHLVDMLFFQEPKIDEYGEVVSCRMHDFIYDLVQSVAGDESVMISKRFNQDLHRKIRHLSVGHEMEIPLSLLHDDRLRLRSLLFLCGGSLSPPVLEELLTMFKLLRALSLGAQGIQVVPSCIGELKHLRYLNLSHNGFMHLPASITLLVNLLTLDISWCKQLEVLPDNFRQLSNLRHLDTKGCDRLKCMPPGLEELTHLQFLSFFKVGRVTDVDNSSSFNALAGLKQLKGELEIKFDEDMHWDDDNNKELPEDIRVLTIRNYPGNSLPYSLPRLVSLCIGPSSTIKQISAFRHLPCLEHLHLSYLERLEYIEIEELSSPCLKALTLEGLPALKGWSREVETALTNQGTSAALPLLTDLTVRQCRELKFMPLCPLLQTIELNDVSDKLIQQLLSAPSATSLSSLEIWDCDLQCFPGQTLKSLKRLELRLCDKLNNLYLAPSEFNILEELVIQSCSELPLWAAVDWGSFPNLSKLKLIGMPNPDELPPSLQQRQALGKLLINME